MDLSVNIGGVKLATPIIASSACDGRTGESICEVAKHHLGAVVTKTITKNVQPDVVPNMRSVGGGSMINCVFGATLTADQWFNEEFPVAKKAGVPIIGNMAGTHPAESIELAIACEKAGADIIEYPTACPHMANVLEAMYGIQVPVAEVSDPTALAEQIKAVKSVVKCPVIVKFSGIYAYQCVEWAKAVEAAGADGITCTDSIGPVIDIDIATGEPTLGGPRGWGGLTGAALQPVALRMVMDVSAAVKIPVIAAGGVASAEDAIKFFMAGASAVMLASGSVMNGLGVYDKIYDGLVAWMEKHGYNSIDEFRGLTHKCIERRKETGRWIITKPQTPSLIEENCIGCGKCSKACAYGAITMVDKRPQFNSAVCEGCGMCQSMCPRKAIAQNYFDYSK